MKIKLFFVIAFCLLFFSCIKDYHSGNPEKVVLTETNFIYEGDMFEFYLNSEIENLNEIISKLKTISPNDQGYDQAQKDIKNAEKKQIEYKGQISNIIDLSQVGFRVVPDVPRPPCNCLGLRNSIEYLLNVEGVNIKNVSILDKNGKVLSSINTEFKALPEYSNQLLYDRFRVVRKLKGEVLVQVSKLDEQGELMEYRFNGFVF